MELLAAGLTSLREIGGLAGGAGCRWDAKGLVLNDFYQFIALVEPW